MQACVSEIAHAYHLPVSAIVREIRVAAASPGRGQRMGVMGVPRVWLPVLSDYGFPVKRVATQACWGIAAGAWIMALQRRETTSVRWIAVRVAAKTGVPASLLLAVAWEESRFDPRAVSPAGAKGLMQMMPATWRQYGRGSIWNPYDAMLAAGWYLDALSARYRGNIRLVLAAYNAGPGRLGLARNRLEGCAKQTRAYVPAVLARWRRYRIGARSE